MIALDRTNLIKTSLLFVGVVLSFVLLQVALPGKKAEAVVCTNPAWATDKPGPVFPRNMQGMREDFGCANADSYIWLSNYYAGSTVQTPTASIRVFYNINDLGGQPWVFDSVFFQTEPSDYSHFTCNANIQIQLVQTGAVQNMYKNGSCVIQMPAGFLIDQGMLQYDARYGSNIRFVDLNLQNIVGSSNAPIRVVSSFWGARITLADAAVGGGFSTSQASLWTSQMPNSGAKGPVHEPTTYVLKFAPNCSFAPGSIVNVNLEWFDADQGNTPQFNNPDPFGFYLVDDTTGLHVTPPGGVFSNWFSFGGDNVWGAYNVNLIGGHVYRWIWAEITRSNGIQIKMPFSEINADPTATCNQPPTITATASCSAGVISGTATDPDQAGQWMRVHVWETNGTFVGETFANPAGGAWSLPATIDTSAHSFVAYTLERLPGGAEGPNWYPTGTISYGPCGTIIQGTLLNAADISIKYPGIQIETCTGSYPVTDGAGSFTFMARIGTGFCIRPQTWPAGATDARTRAWGDGYYGCPGYGAATASPNYCTATTGNYECQVAGQLAFGFCGVNIDRTWDIGYDIAFIFPPPAINSGTCNFISINTGSGFSGNLGYNGTANVTAGQSYTMRITMMNDNVAGANTWTKGSANGNYMLASSQYNAATSTLNPFEPGPPPGPGPTTYGNWGDPRLIMNEAGPITPGNTASYDYTITAPTSATLQTFRLRMLQRGIEWFNPTGAVGQYQGNGNCQYNINVVIPPPSISCTVQPFSGVYGVAYTPLMTVRHTGPVLSSNLTVTGMNITTNGVGNAAIAPTVPFALAQGATITDRPMGTAIILPAPGSYVMSGTVSASGGGFTFTNIPCTSDNAVVSTQPYFSVTNGDISAGGNFKNQAGDYALVTATNDSEGAGRILAYNYHPNATTYQGASAEFAAYALGSIKNFYDRSANPNDVNLQPSGSGLSFANTVNVGGDNYGGQLGGQRAVTDYYSTGLKATAAVRTSGTYSLTALNAAATDGQVSINGDLTISQSLNFAGRVAVFVNGDVFIPGNITLNQNYPTVADVPFFGLFVRGNIYIGTGAGTLEGVYVAQPKIDTATASGFVEAAGNVRYGIIYTCASGLGVPVATANIQTNCGGQLTFNGMVVAKTIKLHRVAGNTVGGVPAEIFNELPELYLGNPPLNNPQGLYNSAATLPPVL